LRLRNIPRAQNVIEESCYVIQDPQQHRGCWKELFGNDHPVRLEIGTGKGKFLLQLAAENPNFNYIGLEKYSSVLLRGVEEQDQLQLPNLYFVRGEAELLTEYFGKGEIDRIYLNFSDPWPKERNAKRRLPSHQFLQRYDEILVQGGTIEFKTDNRDLFDFGLAEAPLGGFRVVQCTYDLHHDPVMNQGNIMTEYEERFSKKGNPICKFILERDPNADREAMARAQKDLEREAVLRQDAERAFEARKDGESVK
jgi:tRNA (guanine-N7-)-methyltransferase